MRKKVVALTAMLTMAVAALAYAQAQTNTYSVSGSTSPTRAGTSKKPVNISVKFGYKVGEQSGNRPSPVKKYSIKFAGLRVNTAAFPKCSASTLESKGPKGCASGSKVGSGFIKNATGAKDNPQDRSIECNAALSVYNAGNGKGVIYVAGSPSSTDPRTRCAIELAAPIPARYVRSNSGRDTALEFSVPQTLLHPLPTLDNAVTDVNSTISGKTRRYRGKSVSYFQSIGGCVRNRRNITVTFTPETGNSSRAQRLAPCKK